MVGPRQILERDGSLAIIVPEPVAARADELALALAAFYRWHAPSERSANIDAATVVLCPG